MDWGEGRVQYLDLVVVAFVCRLEAQTTGLYSVSKVRRRSEAGKMDFNSSRRTAASGEEHESCFP